MRDRGDAELSKLFLDAIYNEVRFELNPNDEDCAVCGGEGFTHECIDDCCVDADIGCDLCTRQCGECAQLKAAIEKRVLLEVVKACDLDVALEWLKSKKRAGELTDRRDVALQLQFARCACAELTLEERGDAACWIEGLL